MSSNRPSSSGEETFEANVILPPSTPSELSPSKPLREVEPVELSVPKWTEESEMVSWFVAYRRTVKSAVYSYCGCLQTARKLFEQENAAHYRDYQTLWEDLSSIWEMWEKFAGTSTITLSFLKTCIVSFDFDKPILRMKSPRKVSAAHRREMHQLRERARDISRRLNALRSLVEEIELRLEEEPSSEEELTASRANSGIAPFIDLPRIPKSLAEQNASHVNLPSEISEAETKAGEEENEAVDEDALPRLLQEIDFKEFDPIWVSWEPMLENLSEEVKEHVELNPRAQMVGSKKTIFYMHGYDDVANLIYDPACTLDDEIVVVPQGCDPGKFIFRKELDAETIPWCVARRYLDVPQTTTVTVSPVFEIPSAVTNEALSHRIDQLYQNARPQCLPETVRTLRLKWNKDSMKIATAANRAFDENFLQQSGFLFRGLSLKTLAFSMSTFLPVIYTGTMDNEFGPGIYTTEEFNIACTYAGSNGAVMVFKDVDQRELNMWQLNGQQWNFFVSYWLNISLENVGIPSDYKTADIIHGPMSKDQAEARRKKRYPTPDSCDQRVFVSYQACQRLMASLIGIIYLCRD